MNSSLKFKVFESSWDSWNKIFQDAADFADSVGKENVLNISHSCDGHNKGVVTVWYWEQSNPGQMFEINQVNFGE